MLIVHTMVTTAEPSTSMPVRVSVSSQPVVSAAEVVPVDVVHASGESSAVSPDPPSRKRTWMSAVGVFVNAVVSPP